MTSIKWPRQLDQCIFNFVNTSSCYDSIDSSSTAAPAAAAVACAGSASVRPVLAWSLITLCFIAYCRNTNTLVQALVRNHTTSAVLHVSLYFVAGRQPSSCTRAYFFAAPSAVASSSLSHTPAKPRTNGEFTCKRVFGTTQSK